MDFNILILAGGLGKRMNSDLPKVLHKLNNKTLLQRVIETSNKLILDLNKNKSLSPNKIGIIVGKYKEEIQKSINESIDKDIISNIEYIYQEEPMGTGHAVQCASEFIGKCEKVLILSGDVPLIKENTLKELSELKGNDCNLLIAEVEDSTGYGRIKQLENNNQVSIIEEKDCTMEEKEIKTINAGIYCFDSKKLLEVLPKLKCNNAQQEYYLTDTIKYLESVNTILVKNNIEIQGVNTKEQLEKLEQVNISEQIVGIIGLGFVGSSIYESLKLKGCNVLGYDKDSLKSKNNFNELLNCNILFLCLPTIYDDNLKQYDKSCIIESCKQLEKNNYFGIIIIKSTVEPKTTEKLCIDFPKLKFIHNPEFLTAATAFYDFHNQSHIVIGKSINSSDNDITYIVNFYNYYYKNAEISLCTTNESECMKSFVNCFYSVKIQFFNELYLLCQNIDTDYNIVKNLMLKNGWINQMHTQVPGTDGKLSYGGYCFPKDTNALLNFMIDKNSPHEVLKATINERNIMRSDNSNIELKKKHNNDNNINFNQLLDRTEIEINDFNEIKYLHDKKILVTGGLGSIGSEIVSKLLKFNTKIIIYDNNEYNYFYYSNIYKNNSNIKLILGCICDYDKLENIICNNSIDIIYHVAAYKHVPVLEDNEYEAVKVNIIGSKNVVDIAIKYNIKKFIYISTDKAVNPTNIMGYTKRISEIYINYLSNIHKSTKFIITRFGNVIGSSGSVIPIFIERIKNNLPLEITDINITRYLMTISEAAKLVLLSSCIDYSSKTILFDMGEPIKIYDLAKKLLKMYNREDLEIKIIGLRPGEKKFEELYYEKEHLIKTKYPKLIVIENIEINFNNFLNHYNELIKIKYNNNNNNIRNLLKKITI